VIIIFNKLIYSYKNKGFFKTIFVVFFFFRNLLKKIFFLIIILNKNVEERFTIIYKKKLWGKNLESVSGPGSSLKYTYNLRKELPNIFHKFNIKSILDAPCGDFNWMRKMKKIMNDFKISYIGGDIVKELVDKNNLIYSQKSISFLYLDIRFSVLPDADLLICRDCLFHFSFNDAFLFLNNFLRSNIKYLLTSNHINRNKFKNKDITTGDFKLIDLFSSPYNFPRQKLYSIKDYNLPHPEREMVFFSRDQLKNFIKS